MVMHWCGVIAALIYAVILPAKCCISLGSGGCSMSYGGRLTFKGSASSFNDQLLFGPNGRKRIFIFQQPPRTRGRGLGLPKYFPEPSGSGRIWISNGRCRGPQTNQGLCPLTEDRPCLDSKMPCNLRPPSYSDKTPLTFSDVTPESITVSWPEWDETTDEGSGPVETYIIEYRKSGEDDFQGIRKGLNLSHMFQNLTADTEYGFRLVVVRDHPNGEGPPSETQTKRTLSKRVVIDQFRKSFDWVDGEVFVTNSANGSVEVSGSGKGLNGYNGVTNLTADSDGVGKLILTWSPPDLDDTQYECVGYVVRYSLKSHTACSQDDNSVDEVNVRVNDTGLVLTDLEDYASYNISVAPRTRTVGRNFNAEKEGNTVSIIASTEPNGPLANLEPAGRSQSSSSATKVMFSWNGVPCENHNGPGFTYNCVLYRIMDGERSQKLMTEVNVTKESHVFNSLKSCGRYRIAVTPQNKMKAGATEIVEISTSPKPFGVIQDFSFTPNFENFTFEWRPPRYNLCPVTSYTLTTTLQKQQACTHCVVETAEIISDIQDTSCVLDNLLPFATYIVSITTYGNDVNMTGSTFEDVITTPKRAPASSPTVMLDPESRTQTSLTFRWDQIPCEDLNGVFIQYSYILKEADSDVIIEEGSIRDQAQNQITFTGLTVCTNYTFSIRVDNDAYNGDFNTIYGTTNLAVPGNDVGLVLTPGTSDACTDDGTTCLIATWRTPQSNNCPITAQTISLHQIDEDNCRSTNALISSFNINVTKREQIFTGLEPYSLYRATLTTGNSAGSTEVTQELRTPEDVPSGAPAAVAVQKPIRGKQVNITWEQPECGDRRGSIIGYKYRLSQGRKPITTDTTPEKWHLFKNLQRGTTYKFSVRALTATGEGPLWRSEQNEPFYFTTRQ